MIYLVYIVYIVRLICSVRFVGLVCSVGFVYSVCFVYIVSAAGLGAIWMQPGEEGGEGKMGLGVPWFHTCYSSRTVSKNLTPKPTTHFSNATLILFFKKILYSQKPPPCQIPPTQKIFIKNSYRPQKTITIRHNGEKTITCRL